MLLPIEGNNIIIGNVRIRQLRVKSVAVGSSGCHVPDMVRALACCTQLPLHLPYFLCLHPLSTDQKYRRYQVLLRL
jgi:hypothetical protein